MTVSRGFLALPFSQIFCTNISWIFLTVKHRQHRINLERNSMYCFFSYANKFGELNHTATAIPFIYFFSGNCAASAPISTFMCLVCERFIYSQDRSTYFLQQKRQTYRGNIYFAGNWDWCPDIPFLGIFVSNFRHFAFAVHSGTESLGSFIIARNCPFKGVGINDM